MAEKEKKVRKAAQARTKVKAKVKPKTDAKSERVLDLAGPKPAPKDGPMLYLRARSRTQIDRIKQAAKKANLSMNTWACEVLERAAAVQ